MQITRTATPLRKAATTLLGTLLLTATLAGCGEEDSEPSATSDGCAYVSSDRAAAKKVEAPSDSPAYEGELQATISTSVGDIDVTLDADAAPCTVHSFASLAEQGYFDDTTCHRIIGGFMIQCGDPSASGTGGPGYQYADELTGEEEYPEGTLAMANAGPDTNGSQFFMVSGDASHLTGHTVFGKVSEESLAVIRDVDAAWASGEQVPVDIEGITISQ